MSRYAEVLAKIAEMGLEVVNGEEVVVPTHKDLMSLVGDELKRKVSFDNCSIVGGIRSLVYRGDKDVHTVMVTIPLVGGDTTRFESKVSPSVKGVHRTGYTSVILYSDKGDTLVLVYTGDK